MAWGWRRPACVIKKSRNNNAQRESSARKLALLMKSVSNAGETWLSWCRVPVRHRDCAKVSPQRARAKQSYVHTTDELSGSFAGHFL